MTANTGNPPLKTVCAHYSGRVQGVGFRWTTQKIAANFPVTGYVGNLSDGRVELLAQGAVGDVTQFLAAVERRLETKIETVIADVVAEPKQYAGFEIRR